jgi:integrase/recombinase XerD
MKKQSLISSPIITEAKALVVGFDELFDKLEQKVILGGLSKSTLINYGRCIAKISLHFKKIPTLLQEEQINGFGVPTKNETNLFKPLF